jgi:hypothetical protein
MEASNSIWDAGEKNGAPKGQKVDALVMTNSFVIAAL